MHDGSRRHSPISELLSAAVIAGGVSSRFGSPKALATFQDIPLIEHALALAHKVSSTVFLNSGEKNQLSGRKLRRVEDRYPLGGPLSGIYSVLKVAATPWVAVLPCDMPCLSPDIYRLLFEHVASDRPVVANSGSRLEPMVSIWPQSAGRMIHAALDNREYALHRILESLDAIPLRIPDHMPAYRASWFYNINRRSDLDELRQLMSREQTAIHGDVASDATLEDVS